MVLVLLGLGAGAAAALAGDWPQWMGPGRDGHAAADEIPKKWRMPEREGAAWRLAIGTGFSSPIIVGDRLIYADAEGGNEVAHCVDARTGKEIWKRPYAAVFGDEWGVGPRATPFSDGERLYIQSCDGHFLCVGLEDGATLWQVDFHTDYGVEFLGSKVLEGTARRRGNNGSGVVAGEAVIVPVGSSRGATLVAFDRKTGRELWRTGNEEAAYAPLGLGRVGEKSVALGFMADSLMAVDAADGRPLWRAPLVTKAKRHAAMPLVAGGLALVNSHTFGLKAWKLDGASGAPVWSNDQLKINLATQVVVDGAIYSQGPNRDYVCADLKTGKTRWSAPGFGREYSATIAVGERLIVLTDQGELVVLEANPEKAVELHRTQICGKNWNYPALAHGLLYIRDQRDLAAYPISAN